MNNERLSWAYLSSGRAPCAEPATLVALVSDRSRP